jgi:Zn-dependent peptidase ImmA (M78 family)
MGFRDLNEITIRTLTVRQLAENFGVRLEFEDLRPPLNGFYKWHPQAQPVIVIAAQLKSNPVVLKCTIWEELGHHFTASEEMRRHPFTLYSRTERRNDHPLEKQALRWASVRLISELEIRWFIAEGGGTLEDFARRFGVTEELAVERINALQAHNPGLWHSLIAGSAS